ncbi:hypothetical protein QNI16_03625 [Cytophagaceae bacterium YF14B1]|uniref:Uncharacterized protein n=2 Tax=Xanthocytophaga flava TaxID=3048013 RepID=A0AAE3QMP2_9BACT|nr:hypothetical protein [Xanthocytophaga flavus]MDJ1467950.1 hypothetical protein [Xanthocytophaga flavus]MDJ1479559.1 hypothetical protein [Xanthocytophaga flavus]
MFFLDIVTKRLLVLPTWAMTNLVNQILDWADIDHPTRGKYQSLRLWAQTSSKLIEEVSFIFWVAWIYVAIIIQFM